MTDSSLSKKEELLDQIVSLEKILEEQRSEYRAQKEAIKPVEEKKYALQKAYDEIKTQLDEATTQYNQIAFHLNSLVKTGEQGKRELDRLRRELSRLLDIERIQKEYQERLDEFRNKCLDATWRKENRTDGMGALPHQIDGAILAAVAEQALVADKRGLGKTLTSLIYCDIRELKKVIVICPSDTMDNYIREIKIWTPHRAVIKLGKMNKGQRDIVLSSIRSLKQFVVVLNYEAWRKDPLYIKDLIALKADALILDEAHHAKTLSTSICKGVMDLRFAPNICPGCGAPNVSRDKTQNYAKCSCGHDGELTEFSSIKYVLPMTGTPILNRPQELFPHLKLIDPSNFWKESQFLWDFCVKDSTGHWKWRYNAEREVVKKVGPRYICRDAKSAGVIIPPQDIVVHRIAMSDLEESYPKQYKAYSQVRDFAQVVLDPDSNLAMSFSTKIEVLLRLRQAINWPAGIELKMWNEDTERKETVAKLEVHESIKIDKAVEIIEEIVEEGERVILFSQFKSTLQELERRLGSKSVRYDGDSSDSLKSAIELDFDPKTCDPSNPRWKVVLCNYKSAGEGLNFHSATHEVILDSEWNPGKRDQAYGRIHRMGQTRETTVHVIQVEPSVDSWMASLVEEKEGMIAGFESEASLFRRAYDALMNGEM